MFNRPSALMMLLWFRFSSWNLPPKGYRNGHYGRSLLTRYGPIEDIQVPRMDHGGVEFSVFDRYERRRRDVDAAIGRLFVNGN